MKPIEAQMETFLSEIEASLTDLPEGRRQEILLETRSHLEAMLAARRADGMSETAAWESTRQAFGDPTPIGADIAREWKRAPRYETVGKPLTRAEKVEKVASIFVRALGVCLAYLALKLWLDAHHLSSNFIILLLIASPLFQIWRQRQAASSFSKAAKVRLIFPTLIGTVMLLQSLFHSQLKGTDLGEFLNIVFAPLLATTCLALLIWLKKQEKDYRPWQKFPLYTQNPIGAEEEYRMLPTLSLISGGLMGLIMALPTSEKLIALKFAPLFYLVILAHVLHKRRNTRKAF